MCKRIPAFYVKRCPGEYCGIERLEAIEGRFLAQKSHQYDDVRFWIENNF